MIKIVIIEDEINLRETNRLLLENNFPHIKIVGEAGSVNESIRIIKQEQPDIVLLDIELKDGNSFQILQACSPLTFCPIFITAYNHYAIKAIKFSAIDYLLKPVNEFEFCNAINEAIKHINQEEISLQNTVLEEQLAPQTKNKRIILKTADAIYLTPIKDIIFCKSDNSYTTFYIHNKKEIIVSKSIKEFAEILEEHHFLRPHQSYLVNTHYIDRIDKSFGGSIVLNNGAEIPISKRMKASILDAIDEL